MTDLHCQVCSSYLIATGVGSSSSQYQWTVLRLTSLAQVRSSGLDLAKILSRKLNFSRLICGRHRTEKRRQTSKALKSIKQKEKVFIYYMTGVYQTNLIFPKSCRRACVPSPLDDTSNCCPPRRSNGSSSSYWSLGFQKSH